jgi:hypothetical protein
MSIGFSNEGSALNPKPSPLNELLNLKRRPHLSGGVGAIEDKEKGRVGRERPDLSEMCSFGLVYIHTGVLVRLWLLWFILFANLSMHVHSTIVPW